jgi:hypothetical protein
MVSRGTVRALGVSLAALLLIFVGASAVTAAPSCTVTVSPASGAAGTVFKFNGKGFEPNHMSLHHDDSEAGSHDLKDPGDPWTLSVHSRPGDEGKWSAEFYNDDCSAAALFTVTLSNTDVADVTSPTSGPGNPLSLPLAALVLVLGSASGVLLGRKLQGTVDNRAQ